MCTTLNQKVHVPVIIDITYNELVWVLYHQDNKNQGQ